MQANTVTRTSPDIQLPPGIVELREDVPLKSGSLLGADGYEGRCCGGGPRFILACFAVLTAGITLALLTQIYYGDYELVPHGSVSSSAADCSRAGTDALKAGGLAIDAAAATALCLAVLAPHRTSIDASGSLLYWEYRTLHAQQPVLLEWGGLNSDAKANVTGHPPRLLAALASIHARYGVLPWTEILQPAIDLARGGFPVSEGLSTAAAERGDVALAPGTVRTSPLLAAYLERLKLNTSSELVKAWGGDDLVSRSTPNATFAGTWRMFAGGSGAGVAGAALADALQPPMPDLDTAFLRVVSALQQASLHDDWPPDGVATGLAVVDRFDNYAALVTGLSKPFGSGLSAQDGWLRDDPTTPLDLAPAILVDEHVCGTRYVIGAESSSALAQGASALLTGSVGEGSIIESIERARVAVHPGGVLAIEAMRLPPPGGLPVLPPAPLVNATLPYAAVNLVQQKADALLSYADRRGGGLSSRF